MTGARIGCGVFVILTLLLAVTDTLYTAYLLLVLELALPFFSALYLLAGKRRACIELVPQSNTAVQEEPLGLRVRCVSGGLPMPRAELTLACSNRFATAEQRERLMISVPSRGVQMIDCSLFSPHCGSITVKPIRATVTDPLGLFRACLPCRGEACFSVLPHSRYVTQEPHSQEVRERVDTSRAGEMMEECFGIRPYLPGDPLRQIHWKRSARDGEWMIRQGVHALRSTVVILLDLCVGETDASMLTRLDTMLETAVAEINSRLLRGMSVTLTVCGADGALRRDLLETLVQAQNALEQILYMEPYTGAPAGEALIKRIYPDEKAMLFTGLQPEPGDPPDSGRTGYEKNGAAALLPPLLLPHSKTRTF